MIQISRYGLRELLEEAGGVEALDFPSNGSELHCHVPAQLREQLLQYVEPLKGAVAHTSAVEKIFLQSPGLRPVPIHVHPADENLIDPDGTLKQRQKLREILKLEARCRVAMETSSDLIAIVDRRGWHLDCNYTKARFGMERLDVIGALPEEIFSQEVADLSHEILRESFKYPEVPIHCEFWHEPINGMPCQYRAKTVAYGAEAIAIVYPVSDYPWLV